MIGRVIGNYRIEALLGSGGMGSVYRALDLMLDRPVAIKALRADAAAQPRSVERFRMEARTLARLLHPNIATLYTLVRSGDDFYMVMEFCEGETFESILRRRKRLDPAEALPLFAQALNGLEHAHRHDIIHRDIKPANLMRLPNGTVKVMDFGIARLLGSSRLTQTQHTIGTAAYMAPEQIRAEDVDARADVYALGVLLYELLTGRVPFQSESFFEVMQAHVLQAPPPPRQFASALPEALEAVILRALAKNPDDRFSSAAAFREALDTLDLPPLSPTTLAETIGAPIPVLVLPSTDDEADRDEGGSGEPKYASDLTPTVALPRGEPAAVNPSRPEARRPAPPRPSRSAADASAAPTVALSPSAFGPRVPIPPASATGMAEAATPRGRRVPRAALGVLGVVLTLAVGVWAFTPGPSPLDGEGSEVAEAADAGSLLPLSSDVPSAPSTALASSEEVAAWVATASTLLRAGHLTTPEDSNALSFAERALAASPDYADARAVVQRIASRSYELGRQAGQRGNRNEARAHFQQAIAVADRHPGVADDERTLARTAIATVGLSEPAAQDPPAGTRLPEPVPENAAPTETPPPATGTLRVLVRPFGDVFVDGQRRASGANAPVFAEVAPGTHRVRVTHPTFGSQERTVRVEGGQTAEVFIEFATPARVTVVSDPINAEIRLDGERMGRYTPATITIPPGRHTVEVRRDGYRPASRSVTIEAGNAPDRLAFTLTPES